MSPRIPMSHQGPDEEAISPGLWESFFEGNRKACARLITKVENEPKIVPLMRDKLAERLGRAVRIGITGPPGVGKSSLTADIAQGLAEGGHRVGVVAVDPSSPFTGGAFMGDRVRMEGLSGNPDVYIRSMASREGHGGLAPTTPYVADVLEGFGMDRILIETVGVGQAELDVLACADMVVLVLQPSTGDAIQTMKAGIIEAANLIVVNKSDLPGVDTVLQSLRFLFSLSGPRPGKPAPPIRATSAQQSTGVPELITEIERLAGELVESGRHREMKRERLENEIRSAIQARLWEAYEGLTGAEEEIQSKAAELAQTGGSPYPYIREACSRVEIDIRSPKDGE
jgi:LAO/AO transport system kinase